LKTTTSRKSTIPVKKPFLKWAGAKTRVVGEIVLALQGAKHERLIEPFVGSGAVALNLGAKVNLLGDVNPDLVAVYSALRDHGVVFIDACEALFTKENTAVERFYELRKEFNESDHGLRRCALFIYLNRHAFNGLCRYNASGKFNVPCGRYPHPYFPRAEMEAFRPLLTNADVKESDFRALIKEAKTGDLVYCDPPYTPLTETGFTAYAPGRFTKKDHEDLTQAAADAAARGALVVISNHNTPEVVQMYRDAGANVSRQIMVARTISCIGAGRKKVSEILAVFGSGLLDFTP
jgi:DNA adenine methylase